MNKNEAKNLSVKDVVEVKADGAKLVVSKIKEYETGKYKITAYDVKTGKYRTFEHADLKVTGETGELPEKVVSKVGRKVRGPKFEIVDGDKFTHEEYDKMGSNAKRNITTENTVVYQDPDNEKIYLSKTVGSNKIYKIEASTLNNAKKVRNAID